MQYKDIAIILKNIAIQLKKYARKLLNEEM